MVQADNSWDVVASSGGWRLIRCASAMDCDERDYVSMVVQIEELKWMGWMVNRSKASNSRSGDMMVTGDSNTLPSSGIATGIAASAKQQAAACTESRNPLRNPWHDSPSTVDIPHQDHIGS